MIPNTCITGSTSSNSGKFFPSCTVEFNVTHRRLWASPEGTSRGRWSRDVSTSVRHRRVCWRTGWNRYPSLWEKKRQERSQSKGHFVIKPKDSGLSQSHNGHKWVPAKKKMPSVRRGLLWSLLRSLQSGYSQSGLAIASEKEGGKL